MPNRRTTELRPASLAEEIEPPLREVMIEARDYRYEPSEIEVEAGQRVRITLVNNGVEAHSIEFDFPDGEIELRKPLATGDSGVLEFTAPLSEGTFTFYCPMGNHHDQGMEGVFVVRRKR